MTGLRSISRQITRYTQRLSDMFSGSVACLHNDPTKDLIQLRNEMVAMLECVAMHSEVLSELTQRIISELDSFDDLIDRE